MAMWSKYRDRRCDSGADASCVNLAISLVETQRRHESLLSCCDRECVTAGANRDGTRFTAVVRTDITLPLLLDSFPRAAR